MIRPLLLYTKGVVDGAEEDVSGSQPLPWTGALSPWTRSICKVGGQLSLSFRRDVATPLPRFLGEEDQRLYKRKGSFSIVGI